MNTALSVRAARDSAGVDIKWMKTSNVLKLGKLGELAPQLKLLWLKLIWLPACRDTWERTQLWTLGKDAAEILLPLLMQYCKKTEIRPQEIKSWAADRWIKQSNSEVQLWKTFRKPNQSTDAIHTEASHQRLDLKAEHMLIFQIFNILLWNSRPTKLSEMIRRFLNFYHLSEMTAFGWMPAVKKSVDLRKQDHELLLVWNVSSVLTLPSWQAAAMIRRCWWPDCSHSARLTAVNPVMLTVLTLWWLMWHEASHHVLPAALKSLFRSWLRRYL